jgi:membrane protein YdbS with pleckstrin-like domain
MAVLDRQTERAAEWVYTGVWRVLSDWFRVPQTPPTLPTPPGEEPDAFKPSSDYLRYLKLWFWIGLVVIDVAILVGWLFLMVAVWWLGLLLAVPAFLLAVVPDIVAYVAMHLRYDTTWYVMSGRSLRIRRGIWVIHEMTFTFENVQNVKVEQGPVQRFFGISDLIVETAGSGGGGDPHHPQKALNQGRIEGVCDAWALRDRVLAKLQPSKSAGLGDDAEWHDPVADQRDGNSRPRWTPDHISTLRSIRDELVAMRGV